MMKKLMMMGLALLCLTSVAQTIKSPDGKILVFLELKDQGKPYYRVNYQGKEVVTPSVLGLGTEGCRKPRGCREL